MIRISLLMALMLVAFQGTSQSVNWKKIKEADPDKILMNGTRKPTKVLLLGTFHFAYPNLDAHKTDSSKHIDVMSAEKQKELEVVAEVLARFKPTRMYIESTRQKFHDSLYAEYQKGKFTLGRNEIFQVGYRMAKRMNHSKLYCIDANSFYDDENEKWPRLQELINEQRADTTRDRYWSNKFSTMYNAADSLDKTMSLLENFLLMAQPATLKRMHGAYLTGGFNTVNDAGPDVLSMWWFSRNLRIFNNILSTRPTSEDRIIVLVGNGHAPILKQCFESSPEFQIVELKSLLNP